MSKMGHAMERKAFEMALDSVMKKAYKNRNEGYTEVVNWVQRLLKDSWPDEAYDRLRNEFSKEGKWTKFFNRILDETDRDYLKGLIMSIGYEGAFRGFRETRKTKEKLGMAIPWVILFDPTSACNLHCTGCWAAEYKKSLNLSYEDMEKIITEGNELGIHDFVMTGGEPMMRKKDILRLAREHQDCGFMIFTNGTLVDDETCEQIKESKNIALVLSIEGMEEATDGRRGDGIFGKVMEAMDRLRAHGLVFGTSICYTSANVEAVTSDEFLDFLIEKGVAFSWYFHYMPIGNDTDLSLVPTVEQREYMYHRIREVRGYDGGKPIFLIDFQNDGEFVSGCIAGGKYYCHINPNGDVEPCVFIHYSGANIKEEHLLECLKQPLFQKYQAAQPFNKNLLQPCPMLENPQALRQLVEESGAHSTDMLSPEPCDHLCAKCDHYSEEWKPVAQKLWSSNHPDYVPDDAGLTAEADPASEMEKEVVEV